MSHPASELAVVCASFAPTDAIYWTEVGGNFVQCGSYVTVAHATELKEKGMSSSLADESASVKLPADGDGPVATVAKTGQPVFVKDARISDMKRGECRDRPQSSRLHADGAHVLVLS